MNSKKLREKAQLHQSEGYNLANSGDLDGGIAQLYQALELYDALDDKYQMITQLMVIGWIKRSQVELDQTLEIFYKQLDLSKEYRKMLQ